MGVANVNVSHSSQTGNINKLPDLTSRFITKKRQFRCCDLREHSYREIRRKHTTQKKRRTGRINFRCFPESIDTCFQSLSVGKPEKGSAINAPLLAWSMNNHGANPRLLRGQYHQTLEILGRCFARPWNTDKERCNRVLRHPAHTTRQCERGRDTAAQHLELSYEVSIENVKKTRR